MKRALFLFMAFFSQAVFAEAGRFFIPLTGRDVYIYENFDAAYTVISPDKISDAAVNKPVIKIKFDKEISGKTLAAAEGKKRAFLSIKKPAVIERTFVIPFELSDSDFQILNNTAETPALYLASLGEKWEVFLNGRHIYGGDYAYRHINLSVQKDFFNAGQNILAFRISGEDFDSKTGFNYSAPYYFFEKTNLFNISGGIFAVGIVFICALLMFLYFIRYFLDKTAKLNLYFALFSLVYGLYFFSRTDFIYAFIQNTNVSSRIELAALFLLPPLFMIFVESFSLPKIRPVAFLFVFACILYSLALIPFSNSFNADLFFLWQSSILIIMPAIIIFDIIIPYMRQFENTAQKNKALKICAGLIKNPLGNLLSASFVFMICFAANVFTAVYIQRETNLQYFGCFLFDVILSIALVHRSFASTLSIKTAHAVQVNYLDLILRHSPDFLILFDSNKKIVNCADSFIKKFPSYTKTDIINETLDDVFKDFLDEATLQNISIMFHEATVQKRTISIFESIDFSSANNDVRQYEIHFTPMFDEKGELQCSLLLMSDTTELISIAEKADRASRAKTSFIATMSHEIRTPLNAILGLAEVQLLNKLPDKTRIDIEKIQRSGRILLDIVNDVLDFSKIESQKLIVQSAVYNLVDIINECVQFNLPRISERPIRFSIEIDETIPVKLIGDEVRIKQILNNILSNAFKYTKRGSVTLSINYQKMEDNGVSGEKMLVFIAGVRDTGIGIKEDNLSGLFGEYTRLDYTENKLIEGTGLGLSITKKLIDLMNGEISVQSEYGKGSEFIMRIPQEIADNTPLGEETAYKLKTLQYIEKIEKKKLVRKNYAGKKVLVVDDVSVNIDVAKGLISLYGIETHGVLSGKTAVELVRYAKTKYDMIIMDHMMPEMSGIDAVRIIRKEIDSDYARNVPIIVFTANTIAENRKGFMLNGFSGYLAKPIDVYELDEVLNSFLDETAAAQPETNENSAEEISAVENTSDINDEAETLEETALINDNDNSEEIEELSPITTEELQAEEETVLNAEPQNNGYSEYTVMELLKKIHDELPQIDIDKALDNYSLPDIVFSTLKSFTKTLPEMLAGINSPDSMDIQDYTIKIHGLKGAIRGIYNEPDGALAAELESYGKANNIEAILKKNGEFIEKMQDSVNKLNKILLLKNDNSAKKEKAEKPDETLLFSLKDAASRYNLREMEEYTAELEKYTYEKDGDIIEWLRKAVDNLEYNEIVEKLGQR